MIDFVNSNYFYAFLLTLFAGLSTTIGATLAFFSKTRSDTFLSIGLGFSAGIMIYVSFMEIIVKSMDSFTTLYSDPIYGKSLALLWFFIGILFSAFIDRIIPHDHSHSKDQVKLQKDYDGVVTLKSYDSVINRAQLKRTGIFVAIAIAIHNFPEGFATFVSSLNDLSIGIPIALAIALHNIPEGMAVSLPIYHATGDKKKAFWYATFSGLAEPLGAIIGFMVLLPLLSEATLGITFGLVAGIMIYISFDELLPSARVYSHDFFSMIGLVAGMLVMASSLILFEAIA